MPHYGFLPSWLTGESSEKSAAPLTAEGDEDQETLGNGEVQARNVGTDRGTSDPKDLPGTLGLSEGGAGANDAPTPPTYDTLESARADWGWYEIAPDLSAITFTNGTTLRTTRIERSHTNWADWYAAIQREHPDVLDTTAEATLARREAEHQQVLDEIERAQAERRAAETADAPTPEPPDRTWSAAFWDLLGSDEVAPEHAPPEVQEEVQTATREVASEDYASEGHHAGWDAFPTGPILGYAAVGTACRMRHYVGGVYTDTKDEANKYVEAPAGLRAAIVAVQPEPRATGGQAVFIRWTDGGPKQGWTHIHNLSPKTQEEWEPPQTTEPEQEVAYTELLATQSPNQGNASQDGPEGQVADAAATRDQSRGALGQAAALAEWALGMGGAGLSPQQVEQVKRWYTVTDDGNKANDYVYASPARGYRSIAWIYPGDRLPGTGHEYTGEDGRWLQVFTSNGQEGWVDAAATNVAALDDLAQGAQEAEARRAKEVAFASDPSTQVPTADASGLRPVGYLALTHGPVDVYQDPWGWTAIGQVGVTFEERLTLLRELAGSDQTRSEILYQGRPGYVLTSEVREPNPLDFALMATRFTDEDIADLRRLLAAHGTEVEPERRHAVLTHLQAHGARAGDADDATFVGAERHASVIQLAACLRFLGVPNPYPALPYADALEMVRVEKDLPAGTTHAEWTALSAAFGVQSRALASAEPGQVAQELQAGNSVMVAYAPGAWGRARAAADGLTLDTQGGAPPSISAGEARGMAAHAFSVTAEQDAMTREARQQDLSDRGTALDAGQTGAVFADLYARTSAAVSGWYESALGTDTSRQPAKATATAHFVRAEDAATLAQADAGKIRDAFRRLLGQSTEAVVEGARQGALFLNGLLGAPDATSDAKATAADCVSTLRPWIKVRIARLVTAPGPAEAAQAVAAMDGIRVGTTGIVSEDIRDVLKDALSSDQTGPGEGSEVAADLALVQAISFTAAYGEDLRSRMADPQLAAESADIGAAAKATFDARAGSLPADHAAVVDQPGLGGAWARYRYAAVAGWSEVHAAYDRLFKALEASAAHERKGAKTAEDRRAQYQTKGTSAGDDDRSLVSTLDRAYSRLGMDTTYKWSGAGEGPEQERIDAMWDGSSDADTFWCSGFTGWTLAADGYDVNLPVLGIDDKPHGWREGTMVKQLKIKWLIDGGAEALAAMQLIMDRNGGAALHEIPGTVVDLPMKDGKADIGALGRDNQANFDGNGPGDDDATHDHDSVKGAVAALVATGLGAEVHEDTQKPGDMGQRRSKNEHGLYDGKGHAFQVATVRVRGAAIFGREGSPEPAGANRGQTLEGWHEDVEFDLDRFTDPNLVGALEPGILQQGRIDANIGRAAGAGVALPKPGRSPDTSESGGDRYYYGRMFTNPWTSFDDKVGRATPDQA